MVWKARRRRRRGRRRRGIRLRLAVVLRASGVEIVWFVWVGLVWEFGWLCIGNIWRVWVREASGANGFKVLSIYFELLNY